MNACVCAGMRAYGMYICLHMPAQMYFIHDVTIRVFVYPSQPVRNACSRAKAAQLHFLRKARCVRDPPCAGASEACLAEPNTYANNTPCVATPCISLLSPFVLSKLELWGQVRLEAGPCQMIKRSIVALSTCRRFLSSWPCQTQTTNTKNSCILWLLPFTPTRAGAGVETDFK